jgi:hypothetical protein
MREQLHNTFTNRRSSSHQKRSLSANDRDCRAHLRACDGGHAAGLRSDRVRAAISAPRLSDDLTMVNGSGAWKNAANDDLMPFGMTYTLRCIGQTWRIVVAAIHAPDGNRPVRRATSVRPIESATYDLSYSRDRLSGCV